MSSTFPDLPETFSPPPRNTAPTGGRDDQPRSSSLYLCVHPRRRPPKERPELTFCRFTFLSTLFLLLVVSTAIVLRSFLLRRRYRMGVQEQLDDLFRQPGGPPGASRRKNFGAKPKLWNTWINLDDAGNGLVNDLAEIKVRCIPVLPSFRKPQPLPPSRSLLRWSHERLKKPRIHLLRHRPPSPSKTVDKSGPPPSWLASSPTHSHDITRKTIIPESTRLTRPRKYLARFKFRLSSPCQLRITRNTLRMKSFPTLRLGSLDFLLPWNNKVFTFIYFVFLELLGLL